MIVNRRILGTYLHDQDGSAFELQVLQGAQIHHCGWPHWTVSDTIDCEPGTVNYYCSLGKEPNDYVLRNSSMKTRTTDLSCSVSDDDSQNPLG